MAAGSGLASVRSSSSFWVWQQRPCSRHHRRPAPGLQGPSLVANTPELPRPWSLHLRGPHTELRPLGSAGGSVYKRIHSPKREQPELASWGSEGCHLPAPPPRGTVRRSSPRRPDCKRPEEPRPFPELTRAAAPCTGRLYSAEWKHLGGSGLHLLAGPFQGLRAASAPVPCQAGPLCSLAREQGARPQPCILLQLRLNPGWLPGGEEGAEERPWSGSGSDSPPSLCCLPSSREPTGPRETEDRTGARAHHPHTWSASLTPEGPSGPGSSWTAERIREAWEPGTEQRQGALGAGVPGLGPGDAGLRQDSPGPLHSRRHKPGPDAPGTAEGPGEVPGRTRRL